MKTVIVPVDDTELSERALPVAGAIAAAAHADLVLITLDSARVEPAPIRAHLEALHDRLPAGVHASDVVALDDDETVEQMIVREAYGRPSSAVVMATHARTGVGGLVLGNTAGAVLQAAPCPLVLVGPRSSTAWSPGPTLVAVDGSPVTDRVLDVAAGWAAATGSHLDVLHVLVREHLEGIAMVTGDPELAERSAARLRAGETWATSHTIEAANPAEAIVRWATERGSATIITGSERPGRAHRALLGSVALAVVRHAQCPVMVVGTDLPSR